MRGHPLSVLRPHGPNVLCQFITNATVDLRTLAFCGHFHCAERVATQDRFDCITNTRDFAGGSSCARKDTHKAKTISLVAQEIMNQKLKTMVNITAQYAVSALMQRYKAELRWMLSHCNVSVDIINIYTVIMVQTFFCNILIFP